MTATLVLTAHPGDFVWRAGGAIALATARGQRVVIGCMSFGERGESASLWRQGYTLQQVKDHRRGEAEEAAKTLGAQIRFFDANDYPLVETPELLRGLIDLYREVQPATVLTHAPTDPYNNDHGFAHALALKARVLAQAPGVEGPGGVIGAPPVFCFEPHQPEQCGFLPNVLLDVTEVWETKCAAMRILAAQKHLHTYYTELGSRRGLQAARNSGPNLGLPNDTRAEAYMRIYPQVTRELS
ncbi:PIG-L deacetylase family protein [Actinoplanes couchii]|nr:PIG-L deacetylase family protein [Actinoplanes couchii]MDR6321722.1 4-oxalomesaconate hydratase [Actinoplanes couchii]